MYCKFCGSQIDDNSAFCSKCGKSLTSNQNQPPNSSINNNITTNNQVSSNDILNSKVNYRTEYKNSTYIAQIIGVLLNIIGFAISLALFFNPPQKTHYMYSDSTNSMIEAVNALYLIIAITCLVDTIICAIKLPVIKRTFICVTDNGIYGSGGSNFYFSVHSFSLSFEQITDIYQKGNSVYIESGGNIYRCAVEYPENIVYKIKKIKEKREKPTTHFNNYRNSSENEWQCPQCGRINQSYIYTCGCGEANPNIYTWVCPKCGKANKRDRRKVCVKVNNRLPFKQ